MIAHFIYRPRAVVDYAINAFENTEYDWHNMSDCDVIMVYYNYSGDYRNPRALIGREWRHIPLYKITKIVRAF